MADLTGHAAGNGGHSQGTPTAHRALLYSDFSDFSTNQMGVSGLLNHASLERLAYPDYSTFITERGISVFVLRVFYQNNVT